MSATHLLNFHSTASADPHIVPIDATPGRDVFILVGAGAIPGLPSPWVNEVAWLAGSFEVDLWRLPAASNDGSITAVSVDLNAARALTAVVWEDDFDGGSAIIEGHAQNWPNTPVSGKWGTGARTADRDVSFAVFYGQMSGSTAMPGTFDLTAFDNGFAEFADSGVSLTDLSGRLWVATAEGALVADEVLATVSEARPGGWDDGGVMMVSYNQGAPLPADPLLARSPATLSFEVEEGAAAPAAQTINVTNGGAGAPIAFTVADGAPWLAVAPSGGNTPQALSVSIDPSGLDTGSYSGVITITAAGVDGSPQTVAVALTVTAPPPQPTTFKVLHNGDFVLLDMGGSGAGRDQAVVFETPEAGGAKRDCVGLMSITMANGSNIATIPEIPGRPGGLTDAADVDRKLIVYGAGFASDDKILVATITDVADATHAVLSASAQFAVNGVRGALGTDDQAAMNAAIVEAVARARADGTQLAQLLLSSGQYLCASPPTQNGAAKGFAQIELPAISPLEAKVTLQILGAGKASGWPHWAQRVPMVGGTVIRSVLGGVDSDPTWGVASVIGGPGDPLDWNIVGDQSTQFSNMLFSMEGVTVLSPPNPSMVALDLQHVAQMDIPDVLFLVDSFVDYYGPDATPARPRPIQSVDYPSNSTGMALRAPTWGNNALSRVGSLGVQGYFYALSPADHFRCDRASLVYCETPIVIVHHAETFEHTMTFTALDIEAAGRLIQVLGGSGTIPIRILSLNTEAGDPIIDDPGNNLVGEVFYAHNSGTPPTLIGATGLSIVDVNNPV